MWTIAKNQKIDLKNNFHVMGIINCTPDSFSDGAKNLDLNRSNCSIKKMIQNGASIIDFGGESTRPNAELVSAELEQKRLFPILSNAMKQFDSFFSIDTYNASTAEKSLKAGAHIINDVWGLQKDPKMASLIADYQAGIIIMHTNREGKILDDFFEDQKYFFDKSLSIAEKAGIKNSQIVLDPGFGFGKTPKHSLKLLAHAKQLHKFGYPLLAATSRKGFLGKFGHESQASQRDFLTVTSSIFLRQAGFSIFRVHNVKANFQALKFCDSVLNEKREDIFKCKDII